VVDYINEVGNLVVDATDVYDISFKFFVLDTDLVNGCACPGGIVFITRGMLQLIRTEAELATVLAHEIAHVARHHGMLEMEERKNQIMADDAFTEMDMEFENLGIEQDEDIKAVEEEMEQLSFEIFETLVNGRLEQYEKEADELAVIFASRAGYNGEALLTLLQRLRNKSSQTTNEHYTQDQICERIDMLQNYMSRISLPSDLFNNKTRWQEKVGN
jgi:predicted Zn-dependent protease